MADQFDEQAEKLLPCETREEKTPHTNQCLPSFHRPLCPAKFRPAVAAALRKLAFIADVETKKRRALSESLRAELAVVRKELEAVRKAAQRLLDDRGQPFLVFVKSLDELERALAGKKGE